MKRRKMKQRKITQALYGLLKDKDICLISDILMFDVFPDMGYYEADCLAYAISDLYYGYFFIEEDQFYVTFTPTE